MTYSECSKHIAVVLDVISTYTETLQLTNMINVAVYIRQQYAEMIDINHINHTAMYQLILNQ